MNHGTNLLETVKENARFYTAQQLKDAKRARELYLVFTRVWRHKIQTTSF